MRYFFQVSHGEREYRDEVGRSFATPETAKGQAAILAGELALDPDWVDYVVSLTDEHGNEIARLPIHSNKAANSPPVAFRKDHYGKQKLVPS